MSVSQTAEKHLGNGFAYALIALWVGRWLRETWYGPWLENAAMAWMLVLTARQVWTGVQRRRPFWDADSWRRHAAVWLLGLSFLATAALLMVAFEWHVPFFGASRSRLRSMWALIMVVGGIAGVVIVTGAIDKLHRGNPAEPFETPRWMRLGRRGSLPTSQ
jgi:hypothetical protein